MGRTDVRQTNQKYSTLPFQKLIRTQIQFIKIGQKFGDRCRGVVYDLKVTVLEFTFYNNENVASIFTVANA